MNLDLLVLESGQPKRRPSSLNTVDFSSIRIGPSNLTISDDGSGNLSLNGARLVGLPNPTLADEAATQNFVLTQLTNEAASNQWLDSVISRQTTPPGSPSDGDRYLIIATGTGDWTGHEDQIATWDNTGSVWLFYTPVFGAYVAVRNETDGLYYFNDSSVWVKQLWENLTASLGITRDGNDFELNLDSTPGLEFTGSLGSEAVRVKVDTNTINRDSSGLSIRYEEIYTNGEAGDITQGQIVYLNPSTSQVNLAQATISSISMATVIGVVKDSTITSGSSGSVYVRPGIKLGFFSGLAINLPVYLSKASSGAVVQNLTGFAPGDKVLRVGYAVSPTEIIFEPEYLYEF